MPQPFFNAPELSDPTDHSSNQQAFVCPNPLTPPPERHEQYGTLRIQRDAGMRTNNIPSPGNTAADMAQSQEDSVYLSPVTTPEVLYDGHSPDERDKMHIEHDEHKDGTKTPMVAGIYELDLSAVQSASSPSPTPLARPFAGAETSGSSEHRIEPITTEAQDNGSLKATTLQRGLGLSDAHKTEVADEAHLRGLAPIDLQFNRTLSTKPWSFTNRRLTPDCPSHVFQSFSRYSGTQQSDRQIYNVDVTILTVDMAQCTMTGYLLIRGLTPEHDTLQTYFTGEIIGGPPKIPDEKQYYTFRTSNPSWGATEKTDLTHWARFPAWRPLSAHAKRDINFAYPTDGGAWWQQENVFMRWKEHFLVPDHKTKSIAGASFEGFYYICLNQVQGRISGIYYHSKSEKYQQLELKHEGRPDVFNRGVTPCVEFR